MHWLKSEPYELFRMKHGLYITTNPKSPDRKMDYTVASYYLYINIPNLYVPLACLFI